MFEISIDVVAAAAVALLAVQSQKKVEFQQLWRIVLLSNGHHAKSVDPRIQMINFRRRYHSVQVPERLQRRCCRHVIAFVTVLSSYERDYCVSGRLVFWFRTFSSVGHEGNGQ